MWPLRIIKSLARPCRCSRPSASMKPTSPLISQPSSVKARAVSAGSRKPGITLGALNSTMPGVPGGKSCAACPAGMSRPTMRTCT
ncbi:hypothetical protein D3C72_2356630 [compost metagenome]